MGDLNYLLSLKTKLEGEKDFVKAQKHLSKIEAKTKKLSAEYAKSSAIVKKSSKIQSSSLANVKNVTKMNTEEYKRYNSRLRETGKLSSSPVFKRAIENDIKHANALRASNRALERQKTKIKEVEKVHREYSKAQSKTQKEGKNALDTEKKKNAVWTKGAGTQAYVNKLLTKSGNEYQKLTSRITETGDAQTIANDISKRGYKTLTPELKKTLATRVKQIETIRKSGVTVDANTKKQHEAIMTLNNSLKKHHKIWGKTGAFMERQFGRIKKAGMMFLTILGPLFLVGAALRTVKQAADWVYQPFIKFEDAMYELRKTANLTKDAMLEIGEAISELSLRIPVAAEELAKIAATAGRLGIRGRENILAFTETIAKMSVATVLSADEAAEALARIRQAFAIPVENIEYLGSVINELSNTTASNSRDIVAALGNIGAAGKMLNITADEASAMSATLIASGMAATRSGTRIRRMLTEMARKSEKMAETMGISANEMKQAIEKDPMEALLMYLKHLSETESRVDKLKEAHEIFGKVGGFAVATLAENYVELIKNLETANEEMAFGTSLQREFAIATEKTSAQLQLLINRSDAAKRGIGEDLTPALIASKSALTSLTEGFAYFVKGITIANKEVETSTRLFEIYYEELERLKKEAEEGTTVYEQLAEGMGIGARSAYDSAISQEHLTKNIGKAVDEMIIEKKLTEETRRSIITSIPIIEGFARSHWAVKESEEELAKKTLDLNAYISTQSKIVYGAKLAWQELYEIQKEMAGEDEERTKETKTWIEYQNKIPSMLGNIEKSYEDVDEQRMRSGEVLAIEEALERKAMQTTLDSLKVQAQAGTLIGENADRYEELTKYMASFNNEEGKSLGLIGDSSAAFQLNNQLIEWQNKEIKKSSVLYKRLNTIFGDKTDQMIKDGKVLDGLNEKNMMIIQNGKDINIVLVENNKYFEDNVDIVSEANSTLEKYGEGIEEVVDMVGLLNKETRDLVDATKDLWDEVDSLTNVYSSALEAQYDYQEMEKRMPSIVKNVLSPMQSQIDLAKDLVKAGKDDAAALELATVADQLYAQGLMETNKRRQAAYLDAYKYIDSMTEAIAGAPSEVAAAKAGIGELFEAEPLMVDADFSLFKEKFKIEIEEAYFDKEYRILIKPEITEPVTSGEEEGFQHGGRVPKTGYYKLHYGEEVITKQEVDSHNEDNSFHVSMNGVTLSDGYNAQKLLKDIEEFSLSRL